MKTLIDNVVLLSPVWRYCILLMLGLLSVFVLYQNFLQMQITTIQRNENMLSQINHQIDQYYRNQNQIIWQQQAFNDLAKRLSAFETELGKFNESAPERVILDSAVSSNLKAEEIKISKPQQDKLGYYYLISIKVIGVQKNINKFFSQLLTHKELTVWEQLEFKHATGQLSMSLAAKYYFGIVDYSHE